MRQGDVDCRGAAHRRCDEDGPFDPCVVHHGHGVVDAGPTVLRLVSRLSELPGIERDASVPRSQSLDDSYPAPSVGDPGMEEDDVGAV
jgi:hypothetical protein